MSEFEAVKAAMGKITAKHREEVRMLKDQSLDQQKKLQREVLRASPLAQPPRHPPPMPPLLFSVSPSSLFESPLQHRTPLDNKIFPSPWCSLDFLVHLHLDPLHQCHQWNTPRAIMQHPWEQPLKQKSREASRWTPAETYFWRAAQLLLQQAP